MSGFSPEENLRFGHRLAISRAKAGYTQKSFAQAINFNQCEMSIFSRPMTEQKSGCFTRKTGKAA